MRYARLLSFFKPQAAAGRAARPLRPQPLLPARRAGCLLLTLATAGHGLAVHAADHDSSSSMCPAPPGMPRRLASPVHESRPDAGAKFDITSDKAIWGLNGDGVLQGHVIVRQGDREVTSDDGEYDSATNGVTVKGSVEYQDPLIQLSGSNGQYSPTGGASFYDTQFELLQRDARGTAQLVDLTPGGILRLQGVTFTTCPLTDEAWQLHASTLTLDTGQHSGVARDASVDFKGIPVLYLPWLSFPLDDERKSGFLFPSIGTNSRSGAEVEAPWYWNIAPNADFTFEPTYYSRRGIDIGGDARYMTEDQNGQLVWHFIPHDDEAASEGLYDHDRSYVHLTQTTQLPDDFRLHVDAANVGDSQYFQDFGDGPEGTSVAYLERSATLSYRDENWRLSAGLEQYQTLDAIELLLDPTARPYARLPRIVADSDFAVGPDNLLHYGVDSEIVNFDRDVGVTGWRLDLRPNALLDFSGPGYFVRPGIAWEYTQYSLDNTAPGQPHTPDRTVPTASFDTGLIFDRSASDDRTLTLEPRLLYVDTPYRNQSELPLFDTGLPDLNLVELFRTNRYVGADRVGDADQVSTAVTSRLLDTGSGQQFLSATLGQIYYFETPRVFIPYEAQTGLRSDMVGEVSLTAYKYWNLNFDMQWDPQTSQSDRTIVELQFKPATDAVINVAYRFQRDNLAEEQAQEQTLIQDEGQIIASDLAAGATPAQARLQAEALIQGYLTPDSLDQVEVSTAWPVSNSWNVYGRVVYALDEHQALERFAGFEYRSCCWGLRLLARRSLSNSTGRQDTGIFLQLELNGLASVGSAAGTFLGTAIRGYSPTSATP